MAVWGPLSPWQGPFSLIRFRSATSGSRELIAVFMAMIIGLASGTGYLLLAVLFTIFLLAVWLLLENRQSRTDKQRRSSWPLTSPTKTWLIKKSLKPCSIAQVNVTWFPLIPQVGVKPCNWSMKWTWIPKWTTSNWLITWFQTLKLWSCPNQKAKRKESVRTKRHLRHDFGDVLHVWG